MNTSEARDAIRLAANAKGLEKMAEELPQRPGIDATLRRANEVLSDRYSFTKTWDMERCSTVYKIDDYGDWNLVMNSDDEWCFMLNRMDYLEDLAIAALATGNQTYATKAADLISEWVSAHPRIEPSPSTRTLDTGIRIRMICETLPALDQTGVLNDELLSRVLESLSAQMDYLVEHYLPKYETSNWGAIQTLSTIIALTTLSTKPKKERWWDWATSRAFSELRAQVYPDGVDWEQSTMYHTEVLLYALRALQALRASKTDCPKLGGLLEEQCASMAAALGAQMTPQGTIDTQGDSDAVPVGDVLALAAAVTGDTRVKAASGNSRLDAQNLFEFGLPVDERLAALPFSDLPGTHFDGVDAGLFTTRSSWEHDACFTQFLSGPLGSGHGHSDNLHLSCSWKGSPVLVDSGRYSYREDLPEREELKSPIAHNVPLIDGKSNCRPKGSWGYDDFALPLKAYARHAGGAHYFEAALVGHAPTQVLLRRVLALDCGVWIGVDQAFADGEHTLESLFHLDPSVRLGRKTLPRAQELICKPGTLVLGTDGVLQSSKSHCSPSYNVLTEQELLTASTTFSDQGALLWWLAPKECSVSPASILRGGGEPLGSKFARAIRVDLPDGTTITAGFVLAELFSGVKALVLDGLSFHAKAALVTRNETGESLTILRA